MRINAILVGMAMVLLLVLPAAASDYTLGVFGNANEDDTINMQDVTYTELIILEYRDKTELTDAKHDGKINMQDVTQIELVILGKEKELTIVDSSERTVTVKKPVERIIPVKTNNFEQIRTLRATDKVVGVCKYVIEDEVYYPGFSDYPNIGSRPIDYEVLFECDPDIVFTSTRKSDLEEKLKDTDIAVIRLDFSKLSSFVEEVRKLGYILGKREEADEFIDFYNGQMEKIKERVETLPEEDKPRVYIEADFGGGENYRTCGEGHAHHEMLAAAGGNNIFSDVGQSKQLDPEEVIERNPEIIVKYKYPGGGFDKDASDTGELEEIREEILGRPELQKVTAVENGKVYIITWYTTRGGARYFLGVGYLAKWFHPELFEDLDPKANYQEYLTRFQGLDIDLDDRGVFVYPPLDES